MSNHYSLVAILAVVACFGCRLNDGPSSTTFRQAPPKNAPERKSAAPGQETQNHSTQNKSKLNASRLKSINGIMMELKLNYVALF